MEVCMWVYVWRQCVECVRDMCVYACEGLPNGTHRILRDSLCGMYSMVRESARERACATELIGSSGGVCGSMERERERGERERARERERGGGGGDLPNGTHRILRCIIRLLSLVAGAQPVEDAEVIRVGEPIEEIGFL
jgi:hypothetical protein